MKKLLTLTLLLSSFAFAGSSKAANVTTGAALNNPQLRIQIGQRRRHRRDWDRDRWRERRFRERREGCRDVTVRERRDGETIVRQTRRCD